MWPFGESKKELRQRAEYWRDWCNYNGNSVNALRAERDTLNAELAAEKAKVAELEARPSYTYTLIQTKASPNGIYEQADPESLRVAKLPKYGSTKKCAACGGTQFGRSIQQHKFGSTVAAFSPESVLPAAHQYIIASCERCGCEVQERPLFNDGSAKG